MPSRELIGFSGEAIYHGDDGCSGAKVTADSDLSVEIARRYEMHDELVASLLVMSAIVASYTDDGCSPEEGRVYDAEVYDRNGAEIALTQARRTLRAARR